MWIRYLKEMTRSEFKVLSRRTSEAFNDLADLSDLKVISSVHSANDETSMMAMNLHNVNRSKIVAHLSSLIEEVENKEEKSFLEVISLIDQYRSNNKVT